MATLEQVFKATGKQPAALKDKPVPSVVSLDFISAFDDLCISRAAYDKPLTITDIKAYYDGCALFNDFTEFLHIVQEADRVFVEGHTK